QGTLELMSPSYNHERWKRCFYIIFLVLGEELDIPFFSGGSTTFRREDLEKGLEPDECYYIQNAGAVAGKKSINLQNDPPPDLAVEIDITSTSLKRLAIYAALGVPEIWRFDGSNLVFLKLADGDYQEIIFSQAIPLLRVLDLQTFLCNFGGEDDIRFLKNFRLWLMQTLSS
ncbi:MAG: Uma2 family endonuclease, partial [Anaerolineae bacterium]|nr:Uma2 family endonuclease [Gloeobacterales cyanobacterium ES-bin-313]